MVYICLALKNSVGTYTLAEAAMRISFDNKLIATGATINDFSMLEKGSTMTLLSEKMSLALVISDVQSSTRLAVNDFLK